MIKRRFAVLLCLLLPGILHAQQGPGGGASLPFLPRDTATPTKMYEDIEIMRRLMERDLRSIYGIPASISLRDFLLPSLDLPNFQSHHFLGKIHQPATGFSTGQELGFDVLTRNAAWSSLIQDPHRGWSTLVQDPHRGILLPTAEGSYLPGYGVVFTMTLPLPSPAPRGDLVKISIQPLSAWERTRRELHGEKLEPEPAVEQSPPSVSGTILKLLADNGKNFAQLKENEVITVSITFRNKLAQWGAACTSCHTNAHTRLHGAGDSGGGAAGLTGTAVAADPNAALVTDGSPTLIRAARQGPALGGGAGADTGTGSGLPAGGRGDGSTGGVPTGGAASTRGEFWGRVENHTLLGDLHQKQGRAKEALESYKKGAEVLEGYMNNTWQWDKEQVKAARELYAKMMQICIITGDKSAAAALLEKLDKIPEPRNLNVALEQKPGGPTPPPVEVATLPSKMIVIAPKRLLDQVGSGKISFEDFKKAASVQHLTFVPEVKPTTAPK